MVETRRQRRVTHPESRTQNDIALGDTIIKPKLDPNEYDLSPLSDISSENADSPGTEKAYRLDRIRIPVSKRNLNLAGPKKKKRKSIISDELLAGSKGYTPEQIKNLIYYITVDKMPVKNASRRAKIDETTARAYYNRYNKGKKGKYKVIPQPDLTINRNKKLYDEHTQFITNLYAQNRDLTNNQVFQAINEAFPGLNIAKSTLLTHIHLRMKDVYKKTATGMGEHTSKLKKHHTQFIKDQLRKDPGLPLSKVRLRLLEAYPGLTVDPTTVARHVHHYMEDLYKDTVSAQQNHKRKLFQQHAEFVEELYNDNPDIKKIEVYNELMRFFPELKKKNVTPMSLHLHLKKALGEWYVEHTRIKEGNPRKLYPEHIKFITELFQKNPDLTVPKGILAIEKNFPGLRLGKTTLNRYLKRCGITEYGILRRKKKNA